MSAPDPMTPLDCDLRGYDYMPLFGAKLFSSNLYAESTDAEFRTALRLWWSAWQQCPAGSLPSGDAALALLADFGRDLKGWAKVKAAALRGFVECSDGRLYHPMLCDAAVKAYDLRLKSDTKRATDRERLRKWREAQKKSDASGGGNDGGSGDATLSETRFETQGETRFVGGRIEREEKGSKEEPPYAPQATEPASSAPALPSPKRSARNDGTRLSEDWQPSPECRLFALGLGLDPDQVAAEFRNYWCALPGSKARKLNWEMTFQNRCSEQAARRKGVMQPRETHSQQRRRELGIPSILDFDRPQRDRDEPAAPRLRLMP